MHLLIVPDGVIDGLGSVVIPVAGIDAFPADKGASVFANTEAAEKMSKNNRCVRNFTGCYENWE